jgi:glyoxylase-like metal-dependent hydrolase (beta-lactamase superfamily II)
MADDPFNRDRQVRRGVAETVADGVLRVVADNPSPMTFTGTATYIVGGRDAAVIDPGPSAPAHREAILAALAPGARIRAILVTHSHRDHCAGAAALSAQTAAPVCAFGPQGAGMSDRMRALAEAGLDLGGGEGGDARFRPDRTLADGDVLSGEGWTLRAIHTPGHLSNHLCFALEGTGVVFTGDHVMGWATTMVSPPEGDMAAFLASLELLQGRGFTRFLPGHGPPVDDPDGMIAWQIAHRRAREAQILAALGDGPADTGELVRRLYADVDEALWPAARRNVLAHLLALEQAGAVRACGVIGERVRFALG